MAIQEKVTDHGTHVEHFRHNGMPLRAKGETTYGSYRIIPTDDGRWWAKRWNGRRWNPVLCTREVGREPEQLPQGEPDLLAEPTPGKQVVYKERVIRYWTSLQAMKRELARADRWAAQTKRPKEAG